MPLRQLLLVRLKHPENTYGPFTQEILKGQGLNGFTPLDLSANSLPEFRTDDLAVLTRCLLSREEADVLHAAIERGLRLVCLQPAWNFVRRFGWRLTDRVMHPGWVRIRDGYPGAGTPLQTHVPIAAYDAPAGAEVVADAVTADWQETGFAAAAQQRVGRGEVVFFFYDLAKAVARIRFGNPELASLLNTGMWASLHTCDLFEGHVDERVLHLPQADLHAQVLAKVLTDVCPYPLARLWYFERPEHRAAANFSSDDDWSTPEQFRDLSESLEKRGGHATFYLVQDTHLPDEEVRRLRERGHTFGPHVDAMSPEEADRAGGLSKIGEWFINENWPLIFPQRLRDETEAFARRYGTRSISLQCHGAPWRGYMSWAPDFVASGYRLIYNYMHTRWLNRFMCGAGLPLKMAGEDGTLYDLWQQPLLTLDDASIQTRIGEHLDEVVGEFEEVLRPILERFHCAIGIASHPVSFSTYSKPFLEACFDRLKEQGVPIYSGDEWCRFIDRRHGVQMEQSTAAADGSVSVTLSGATGPLTLMLPVDEARGVHREAAVSVNGAPATAAVYRRLEQDYLYVALDGDRDGGAVEVTVA